MRLPSDAQRAAAAKLILRVVVAGLMLFHGSFKGIHGIDGLRDLMIAKGLPGFVAPGVYLGEIVAPLLIIAGFWTRPAALVLSFNMVVAIATAHARQLFTIGAHGEYPLELQMLFLFGGVVIALLGPGPYSLSRDRTRLG